MNQSLWHKQAAQWDRFGAPLRPSAEDGALAVELARPAWTAAENGSVLILGVTPDLVQLPWPPGAALTAVDNSAQMIATVWAPPPGRPSRVIEADWQDMPLESGSVDVAAGDGSLNILSSTDVCKDVLAQVARVLKTSGRLIVRGFVRPDRAETSEQIVAAAMAGAISSFHALKFRVAMSIEVGPDFSLPVETIRTVFMELFPDRDLLARRGKWPREVVDMIDSYHGSDACYNFPPLPTLVDLASEWFECVGVRYGTYEFSERCPTICFKPRPRL